MPLIVELAGLGERAIALLIDLVILALGAIVVVVLLTYTTSTGLGRVIFISVLMFIVFLLRTAYFIHFELSGNGATPGKRLIGIRVADRRGGPLLASAVIARNLTREIEVFIPIGILITTPLAATGGSNWQG
ncbi:MAG TPA: RDD family protein, partial [Solirubrobacteraceae bacterium]